MDEAMIHLREIQLREGETRPEDFPFNLPVIRRWEPLAFSAPVTILVGENGSGKSTVLEAVACAAEIITVGSGAAHRDPSLAHVHALAKWFKLIWSKRVRKGFFLRAEDFFGFVKRQSQTRIEMQRELDRVKEEYRGRSKQAQELARMPLTRELGDMHKRYGDGLDTQSHGESFLALFQSRFVPGGLYLLDEPEAPLSPLRQLALISMIKQMAAEDSQFIIATHSPILMAYPEAEILSFDLAPIRPVAYDSLEHVNLMRDFLNDPDSFLRYL
ncbi:MAG: AAA family ATPase [Anaerolineales bacterium]|nr:AAA family ATPase [Anaerolineales bacterium]